MATKRARSFDNELEELLASAPVYTRNDADGLAPEVKEARSAEKSRRSAKAQTLAITALRRKYPEEYRRFYGMAVQKINTERGPLPGDEDYE